MIIIVTALEQVAGVRGSRPTVDFLTEPISDHERIVAVLAQELEIETDANDALFRADGNYDRSFVSLDPAAVCSRRGAQTQRSILGIAELGLRARNRRE